MSQEPKPCPYCRGADINSMYPSLLQAKMKPVAFVYCG